MLRRITYSLALVALLSADFNSACESLKIGGGNSFEHKVTLDKFAGLLRVTNR